MEKVVMPSNHAFADHKGIRQAVGHRGDVNADTFRWRREWDTTEHPLELAGIPIGAAVGTKLAGWIISGAAIAEKTQKILSTAFVPPPPIQVGAVRAGAATPGRATGAQEIVGR